MGIGVRACLGSCLINTKDFFTNPENRISKYARSSEGRDKILKCADPLFDTAFVIAEAAGASQDTLDGIGRGRALAKAGRDAHSFLNIFAGVIPALINHLKNIFYLMKGLISGEDVILREESPRPLKSGHLISKDKEGNWVDEGAMKKGKFHRADPKHNDIAEGKTEKILALLANSGNGVAAAAYTFGFAIPRPMLNIEKYGKIKLGEAAYKLAHSFSTVMMINHIFGAVGQLSGIAYEQAAFSRAIDSGKYDGGEAYKEYARKVVTGAVGLLEKFLELIQDIVNMIGQAAPAWFRLPLTLSIGFMGVYKEWRKTA